jgi:hypothetical protein
MKMVTPQVTGFRVQAINEGRRFGSRYSPAWTVGIGGDQASATASFPNPEPSPPAQLLKMNLIFTTL